MTTTRPQRPHYQEARVRPTDLVAFHDVVRIDGLWRAVLGVYTYGDHTELLEMFSGDTDATALINQHLVDDVEQTNVIVRYAYLRRDQNPAVGKLSHIRACELVTVQDQVPGTAPDSTENDDDDPIAQVLGELHAEIRGDDESDVLERLSIRAGLVWPCLAETCPRGGAYINSRNADTCSACGHPRDGRITPLEA